MSVTLFRMFTWREKGQTRNELLISHCLFLVRDKLSHFKTFGLTKKKHFLISNLSDPLQPQGNKGGLVHVCDSKYLMVALYLHFMFKSKLAHDVYLFSHMVHDIEHVMCTYSAT